MLTNILWLDANSDSVTSSFRDKLSQYRWVQTFNKSSDCIDYIKAHLMETFFLITSGSLAEDLVEQVSEYGNIKQIFVFCASIASHTHWAMNYTDKLLMFDHEDDLLARLWIEIEQHFREQAQECIQQADELKKRAKQFKKLSCG
jgi:hypothetical protein